MSTLAETYALQLGVKLDAVGPTIQESFYPLDHPIERAILIHGFGGAIVQTPQGAQAGFGAKIYDHFADVVALLKPVVEPLGYRIYQIGAPGEPGIIGAENLVGKTSLLQCTYLVHHCALLIGNDSLWAHQRGAFGGALVALYGPTSVKNHGPYWKNAAKTTLIESHRFGKKPSYASQEQPKTINVITPERVTNAALALLGAPPIVRTSLYVGPAYNQTIVEIVPNIVVDPSMQIGVPVIRMDLHHDEAKLFHNLQLRKCNVIVNREVNVDMLKQFRQQVASLRVEIDSVSTDWIKQVRRVGVPLGFLAIEKDDAKVLAMRLAYYDACQFDRFVPPTVEDFRKGVQQYRQGTLDPATDLTTLRFRTNKVILSDGKAYLSRAHWAAGRHNTSTDNTGDVIDSPLWFEEVEHFYVYSPAAIATAIPASTPIPLTTPPTT